MSINPSDFHRLEPVPEGAMERVKAIMQSGDMFRYANSKPEDSEAALLERDFAAYIGTKYALGLNSCSSGIMVALLACGVKPGDKVLMPAFTFTAVPGAIVNIGAAPVLVECNNNYRLDIDDFVSKITPETRVLLLSHMRGHISDMDRILELCEKHSIVLIEDAAHALGSQWRGRQIGSFGKVGCYSFQSNKIINAGEGGMITSDDGELIVRCIYYSGAYERLGERHFVPSSLFKAERNRIAPYNLRMNNLTAAIVRPQLATVNAKAESYRSLYESLVRKLNDTGLVEFPVQADCEVRVPDSVQFRIPGFTPEQMKAFVKHMKDTGFPFAGFCDMDNARAYWNWQYCPNSETFDLPQTRAALSTACDMRLSYTLTEAHLDYFAAAVVAGIQTIANPTPSELAASI